ncbi:MAG: hypothetical protein LUG93_11685 [Lachnospiraceae bacterium]|nr:hypothetical protein [Lachnospiraceae bacterium]
MENTIFRKKSMERVSSPEQLNDYLRVANPGIWSVLVAIILLLAGTCIWGIFGKMESSFTAAAVAEGGSVTIYIKTEESAEEGMTVRIGEKEYTLASLSAEPVAVTEEFSEYTLYVGGLQVGEWVYEAQLEDEELADGVYSAEVVTESIAPMSFVVN